MIDEISVNGVVTQINDNRLNNLKDIGQGAKGALVLDSDNNIGKSSMEDMGQMVAGAQHMFFARVWNLANATSKAATWEGNLAFGQAVEEYLGLGCYLVQADHSRRKLAANNHYRFANGGTARLDGSMGHYQWSWYRDFYLCFRKYQRILHIGVSYEPVPGYECYYIPIASQSACGWAALERSTNKLVSYINEDADYRGGNNDASRDGAFNTLLGKPVSSLTTQAFLNAARNVGDGWTGSTMRMNTVTSCLFYVIFGTLNTEDAYTETRDSNGLRQGGLGQSAVNAGNWWGSQYNYQPVIPLSAGMGEGEIGRTDGCGNFTYDVRDADGNIIQTMHCQCFFGLKNGLGGIMWRMMTDEKLVCNDDYTQTHYYAERLWKVNGSYTYNITEADTGFMRGATTPPTNEWQSISDVDFSNLEMIPVECANTSSNDRFCGGYYNPHATSGVRLVLRSGALGDGWHCGPAVVRGFYGLSFAYVDFGSSLCESTEEWLVDKVT